MATRYMKICDGCGTEETLEAGPFGPHQLPEGWVKAAEWGKEGSPEEVIACGWQCLGDTARKRAKQDA